jgi:hypothetical protein
VVTQSRRARRHRRYNGKFMFALESKVLVTVPLGRFPSSSVVLTSPMSVSQAAEGEEAFTLVGSVK